MAWNFLSGRMTQNILAMTPRKYLYHQFLLPLPYPAIHQAFFCFYIIVDNYNLIKPVHRHEKWVYINYKCVLKCSNIWHQFWKLWKLIKSLLLLCSAVNILIKWVIKMIKMRIDHIMWYRNSQSLENYWSYW